METATWLQSIWFVLVGVLLAGYSVLDGFDLGLGVLFPFLAKDEKEKRELLRSIGPVWDGNEVWLLAGGGALFAALSRSSISFGVSHTTSCCAVLEAMSPSSHAGRTV